MPLAAEVRNDLRKHGMVVRDMIQRQTVMRERSLQGEGRSEREPSV